MSEEIKKPTLRKPRDQQTQASTGNKSEEVQPATPTLSDAQNLSLEQELEVQIAGKTDDALSAEGLWYTVDRLANLYYEEVPYGQEPTERARTLLTRLARNEERWYESYIRRADYSAALYRAGNWLGYLEKLGDTKAIETAESKIKSTLFTKDTTGVEGTDTQSNIITKEEFERIGSEWAELNKKYDDSIQNFFDNPDQKNFSSQELEKLASMQQELYALEKRWFQIARGEVVVK